MPLTKVPLIIRKPSASFTQGPASPPSSNIVNLAFANTTKTFSGINGGVDFPAKSKVIVGFADDLGGTTPGTPLIGGQAATEIINIAGKVRLYQATMPGTSQADTFSFATAGGFRNTGVILIGYFFNLRSAAAFDSKSSTGYGNVAQPIPLSAGVIVPSTPAWGLAFVYAVPAPTALTWVNATAGGGDGFLASNPGGAGGTNVTLGFAHTETSGSWSPTVAGVTTGIGFGAGLVAATFR